MDGWMNGCIKNVLKVYFVEIIILGLPCNIKIKVNVLSLKYTNSIMFITSELG